MRKLALAFAALMLAAPAMPTFAAVPQLQEQLMEEQLSPTLEYHGRWCRIYPETCSR